MKEIKRDGKRYHIEKFKSVIKIIFASNKKQRAARKFRYSIFRNNYWKQESNALPSGLYFRPKDIAVIDLIAKKDISNVKKGIIELYKKYYSHKFLMGASFNIDIEQILMEVDQTISNGKSWYKTSIFDFENSKKLKKYIDYFEVEILNISSSYAAMEFMFHFSKEFTEEIENFISENYENTGMYISQIWTKNNKKNGAKIDIATGGGDANESAKSRIVYEQLEYVKLLCMKEMCKIFPLFSANDKNLYGMNIFETNIPCDDSLPLEIYRGLGMDLSDGFLLSRAEKIFVSTDTLYSENKYESDMMYVYNDKLLTDYGGYGSAHNYFIEKLKNFLAEMGLSIIYKNLGIYYYDQIVAYRNKINGIQMNRRNYKKLLKLKYAFEKLFYDFYIIKKQIPIDNESDRMLCQLEKCEYAKASLYAGHHPYKKFVTKPQNLWHKIIENYDNLLLELNKKIEIATSLKNFEDVKKGYHISWYQFLVAIITLYLVIYPDMAKKIAAVINELIEPILQIIKNMS